MQDSVKNVRYIIVSVISLLPQFALAQEPTVKTVINQLTGLLQALIPILAGVALLVFIAGLVEYLFQGGDKSATESGRYRIVAGIIGLFVIAAIWGLVQIVSATLDLGVGV